MTDTKIISAFPASGKTYVYENMKNKVILDSDSSKFSWTERKRTEEELEEARKQWDSEPHLLSGEGYVNQIRDKLIKVRNPDFPQNYIAHIKENIGKADYILVSTHDSVRKALDEAGIEYYLVYPEKELKEEWVGRCFIRGSKPEFCQLIADNWDEWIRQLETESKTHKCIKLRHRETLSNIINFMDYFCEDMLE